MERYDRLVGSDVRETVIINAKVRKGGFAKQSCLKLREVSSKYDISVRALRYYEGMGLIKSIRSADFSELCTHKKRLINIHCKQQANIL